MTESNMKLVKDNFDTTLRVEYPSPLSRMSKHGNLT